MNTRNLILVLISSLALLLVPAISAAQDAGVAPPAAPAAQATPEPTAAPAAAPDKAEPAADPAAAEPVPAVPAVPGVPVEPPPAAEPPGVPDSMPALPTRPKGTPFELGVRVNKVDDAWKKAPVAGQDVLLQIFAGDMMIKTYTQKTGPDGLATFSKLTLIPGARFVPAVIHDGVRFAGRQIAPSSGSKLETDINIYDKTYTDEGLVVTDLLTTIDVVEGFLIYMEIWTLANTQPRVFDLSKATDPKYADGMVIELPIKAEGIEAIVTRSQNTIAEAKVVDNKVMVTEPILPAMEGEDPIRVQIRYSMKLDSATVTFRQPLAYNVDNMRVIATMTTPYKRTPRMDLKMTAPGFTAVGPTRPSQGMRDGTEFMMAEGGKAKAGGALEFTISGFPVKDPPWRWLALFGGLGAVIAGFALSRGDAQKKRNPATVAALKRQALEEEREKLFDALRDLDDRYFTGEVTDRAYDLEVASLRERLSLVLRRLDAKPAREAA